MNSKTNYASDFRHKEVIDMSSGSRLGFISDVDIDLEKGTVNAVIIPGKRRFLGLFPTEDCVIPWENIEKIGEDIILVKNHDE